MKTICLSVVFLVALFGSGLIASAQKTDESDFAGVQKAMSPGAYEQAGLNKLTPDERARLDEFIRGYVARSSEKAATAAVDTAVKNNKVTAPEVIESRLVGRFTGYNGRNRFALENGQVWAQSQQVSRAYPPSDSPSVIIVKSGWGHRMYILGGGNIRVSKVP